MISIDIEMLLTIIYVLGRLTTLAALLQRPNPYVAFDIDWLTIAAGGRDETTPP